MAREGCVVLIHAFPLSSGIWALLRGTLPPGWNLITPDLPGFGNSADPPAASVDDMARSVLTMLDAQGIRRAVIGGMSMGGYVTLALHRMAPERFSGMVLVDSRAGSDNEAGREGRQKMIELVQQGGAAAVADEMLPKLVGPTSHRQRPGVVAAVREMIEWNRPETIAAALAAMRDRADSTPSLAGIAVPTLIVCGEEDALTPPSESEALHQQIAGSRLVLLPRAGHLSAFEVPDVFGAALSDFLGRVPFDGE
jgi:pimeloyl-ACP methyl ester carboxylesterase